MRQAAPCAQARPRGMPHAAGRTQRGAARGSHAAGHAAPGPRTRHDRSEVGGRRGRLPRRRPQRAHDEVRHDGVREQRVQRARERPRAGRQRRRRRRRRRGRRHRHATAAGSGRGRPPPSVERGARRRAACAPGAAAAAAAAGGRACRRCRPQFGLRAPPVAPAGSSPHAGRPAPLGGNRLRAPCARTGLHLARVMRLRCGRLCTRVLAPESCRQAGGRRGRDPASAAAYTGRQVGEGSLTSSVCQSGGRRWGAGAARARRPRAAAPALERPGLAGAPTPATAARACSPARDGARARRTGRGAPAAVAGPAVAPPAGGPEARASGHARARPAIEPVEGAPCRTRPGACVRARAHLAPCMRPRVLRRRPPAPRGGGAAPPARAPRGAAARAPRARMGARRARLAGAIPFLLRPVPGPHPAVCSEGGDKNWPLS